MAKLISRSDRNVATQQTAGGAPIGECHAHIDFGQPSHASALQNADGTIVSRNHAAFKKAERQRGRRNARCRIFRISGGFRKLPRFKKLRLRVADGIGIKSGRTDHAADGFDIRR